MIAGPRHAQAADVATSAVREADRPARSLGILCWGLLFGPGLAMSGVYN